MRQRLTGSVHEWASQQCLGHRISENDRLLFIQKDEGVFQMVNDPFQPGLFVYEGGPVLLNLASQKVELCGDLSDFIVTIERDRGIELAARHPINSLSNLT